MLYSFEVFCLGLGLVLLSFIPATLAFAYMLQKGTAALAPIIRQVDGNGTVDAREERWKLEASMRHSEAPGSEARTIQDPVHCGASRPPTSRRIPLAKSSDPSAMADALAARDPAETRVGSLLEMPQIGAPEIRPLAKKKSRFALDSPLEEGVTSEPVSECAQRFFVSFYPPQRARAHARARAKSMLVRVEIIPRSYAGFGNSALADVSFSRYSYFFWSEKDSVSFALV